MSRPALTLLGEAPHWTRETSKEDRPAKAPPGEAREAMREGLSARVGGGTAATRAGGRVIPPAAAVAVVDPVVGVVVQGARPGTEREVGEEEVAVEAAVVDTRDTAMEIAGPQ